MPYRATQYFVTTATTRILPQALHRFIGGRSVRKVIETLQLRSAVEHLHDQHPEAVHILHLHHFATLLVDVLRSFVSVAVANDAQLGRLTIPHQALASLLRNVPHAEGGRIKRACFLIVIVNSQSIVADLHNALTHQYVIYLSLSRRESHHLQVVMHDMAGSRIGKSIGNRNENRPNLVNRFVILQVLLQRGIAVLHDKKAVIVLHVIAIQRDNMIVVQATQDFNLILRRPLIDLIACSDAFQRYCTVTSFLFPQRFPHTAKRPLIHILQNSDVFWIDDSDYSLCGMCKVTLIILQRLLL